MESDEIYFLSITEASKLIADKQLSPVDVVTAHLKRIAQTDDTLNSFITLLSEESMEAAYKAEQDIMSGIYRGPLHGIPIGLKDLFFTKGVRTTAGSKILQDFVPAYDATVTEKMKEAGAIIMGKLQMHEFAYGSTGENPHYGPACNPWDIERVTGGSSSGSGSAVASGQCMGALGTDTGGSVRIPSSLCGIVGLKPSFGRVSRYGVYPLSWSLDTVGPMTRIVQDAALILNIIAGYDSRDTSSANRPVGDYTAVLGQDVKGLLIGIPQDFFFEIIDPEVKEAVYRAARVLEELGASVDEVSIPVLEHSLSISSNIQLTEAAEIHLDQLRESANDLSTDVRAKLEIGALIPGTEYIKAQRARRFFNRKMAEAMQKFDVLLAPTEPIGAPKFGEMTVRAGSGKEHNPSLLSRLTRPFNICGLPAISVPCGFTSSGLPIGMQLAGRLFDEATVLRVAHAYEQATDWHTKRPPI
ncbi:MAG: Asp-tRNA(Asn)/Glu-tRNA(Gln) amidotransferase subunit GatA [Spirochaetes bacterium]|nr:Asp-tRNA(Asn)/Glu-tRNA(Gln) amidotransferase subunit GatA [Spirochaetota bacterium]